MKKIKFKNQIIIITSCLLFIVFAFSLVVFNTYYNNDVNKLNSSNKLPNGIFVFVDNGDGYEASSSIPVGNYVLDEENSYCNGNGKVSDYDSTVGTIKYTISGQDECAVYFNAIRLTLSETVLAKESDNEYTSSQDGSIYKVSNPILTERNISPYINLDFSSYGTTKQYISSSYDALSGTLTTNKFTFNESDKVWVSNMSGMEPETYYYIFIPLLLPEYKNAEYKFCYKISQYAANNRISVRKTTHDNSERGVSLVNRTFLANDDGKDYNCMSLGVVQEDTAIRVEFSARNSFGEIMFYITGSYTILEDTDKKAGVRYSGANPDNYVQFNGEEWRIVGTFEGSTIGLEPGKNYTKIIRNEDMYKSWDNVNIENDWANSSLNLWLSNDYLNGMGNMIKDEVNADVKSLTTEAKDKIAQYNGHYSAWYLKSFIADLSSVNVHDTYIVERETGSAGWRDGETNAADEMVYAPIGLNYLTDIGYAEINGSCYNEDLLGFFMDCMKGNWLWPYKLINQDIDLEWLIMPNSDAPHMAFYIEPEYGIKSAEDAVDSVYYVRPTLYLEADVMVSGGTGTKLDPYILN